MSLKMRSGDEHILELEAEIERLRTNNDVRKVEIKRLHDRNAEHEHRYDALEAMVDHYRAEVERLKTVLREIAEHRDESGWGETYSAQVARAALEGK